MLEAMLNTDTTKMKSTDPVKELISAFRVGLIILKIHLVTEKMKIKNVNTIIDMG